MYVDVDTYADVEVDVDVDTYADVDVGIDVIVLT